MPREITLPNQSEAAQKAAEMIGARCAVVLTVNHERNTFEVRCYGETDKHRYFAGALANTILDALDRDDPPADWEQVMTTIGASAGRS